MSIGFNTGASTNVGVKRDVNQDSYATAPGIVVVADGMGGHRGGEVASTLAVQEVVARFDRPDLDVLIASVGLANKRILDVAAADPQLRGMGTTLVALGAIEVDGTTMLGAVNVGDSRMYRLSGNVLEQLTEDHNLVAALVREGRLSPDEAENHPQRNVVTRALGVVEHVEVDAFHYFATVGDRYVLCSDGLVDEVRDDLELGQLLAADPDPQATADRLVDAANERGGSDNITVVVVDIVEPAQAKMAATTKWLASDRIPDPVPVFDVPQTIATAPVAATPADSVTAPVTATPADSVTAPVAATPADSVTAPVTATPADSGTTPIATSPITGDQPSVHVAPTGPAVAPVDQRWSWRR